MKENVRDKMNCVVMTRAIFLSHCGVRVMCVTRQVHCTVTEILFTTEEQRRPRTKSAHCANCATTRRTALEVRRSRDTDKSVSTGACHWSDNGQILHSAWFSKYTTRPRIHTCACLKHTNFFNTDRMRKPGLSNCCSHETLLHFGLQQLSQGRVKQLPSNSNLKTGTRAPNLVEHLFFRIDQLMSNKSGLTPHSRMPSRPHVTRQCTSGRTRTSDPLLERLLRH